MILDALLNMLIGLLNFILSRILSQPDVTLGGTFIGDMALLFRYIASLGLTPLVVFFAATTMVVIIEVAIAFYKGIMWIIKKIPGVN